MPLPTISPYSPAQRAIFDAMLVGAAPANITAVLDFLDGYAQRLA